MKKFVLIALAAFGINQAIAQGFSVAHDTAYLYASGTQADVHNSVTNLTTSDITLTWKVIGSNIGSGWVVDGICDNNTCWPWGSVQGGSSKSTNPISTSAPMDLKVQYLANSAANGSMSWVTLKLSDVNAPLNTKNVTFIAYKVATGVVNVTKSEEDIILYPNPAKDNLNIIFNASSDVKNIAIYNVIGKAVKVYKLSGNSAKMDISDIPSGIYFVRLVNGQGQIVATRKFTHQ